MTQRLRIAFIHPDLGIGGAERLVVDAALGLQARGHSVDIYTSHHDPTHCFEETKDGRLRVHHFIPPFPRSFKGKFHILFAHARQLHLTIQLLRQDAPRYDVYFVDQLSTCIPFLRTLGSTRIVFYCHFPDKLLAHGAFVEGQMKMKGSLLKRIYRYPMDWLEEATTRQADVVLANSKFTACVSKAYFKSIKQTLRVVYPGINIEAYEGEVDPNDPDIVTISSPRPTLLSLNRFEQKKNAALAIYAFARLKSKTSSQAASTNMRLVLAGGYDPRVVDNVTTLQSLVEIAESLSLTFNILTPYSTTRKGVIPSFNTTPRNPQILFLLNFTTAQRTALLRSPSTKALLYTPANEHFGIGPVEAMICGLPVLACDSGGPTESILDSPAEERTGWLRAPDADVWADALLEIVSMSDTEREALSGRSKVRARALFGMDAMARGLEEALVEAVGMGEVGRAGLVLWLILVGLIAAVVTGACSLPSVE